MSEKKKPREFWVENGLAYVKGLQPFYPAYSEKGGIWSIHCREVLPEPLISEEEIEKAAEKFREVFDEQGYADYKSHDEAEAFIAGAKWMQEKMK